MRKEIINFNNVTYLRHGVSYLDQINLRIYEHEIVGFLHIDHVGRTQLINILKRNSELHYGKITIQGEVVNTHFNTRDTVNDAIYVLDLNNKFIQNLTVIDNFFVMNKKKADFVINETKYNSILQEVLGTVKLDVEGGQRVETLTLGQQKILEIVKAVYYGAKFIIVLDISDILSTQELQELHAIMRFYRDQGISFGYFCNHHEESFSICDRIFVMENGSIQKILHHDTYSDDLMLHYSFDFKEVVKGYPVSIAEEVFRMDHIQTDHITDLSFSAHKGECVTILNHNSRSFNSLLKIFNGETKDYRGSITIDGVDLLKSRETMSIIPLNPIENFLLPSFSIMDNLMFEVNRRKPKHYLSKKVRKQVKMSYANLMGNHKFNEDLHNLDVYTLYKIIYLRVLFYKPKVVVLVQPFSNANMYLRHDIITLIQQFLKEGITVLILAVSLSDAKFISNRIVNVIYKNL